MSNGIHKITHIISFYDLQDAAYHTPQPRWTDCIIHGTLSCRTVGVEQKANEEGAVVVDLLRFGQWEVECVGWVVFQGAVGSSS